MLLVHRLSAATALPAGVCQRLGLSLDAEQRTSLRGHRRSDCGRDLLLQLPRDGALQPGDWLLSDDAAIAVQVIAAPEPLLRVSAASPLELLQAAYHLGNRHVALELHGDHLLLPRDPVLHDLLLHRGLTVAALEAPFVPEAGAYGAAHAHAHAHDHQHHH